MNEKNLNNGTGLWRAAFLKSQALSLKSLAAAAAVVLVCGTVASASPMYFENAPVGDPGHFVWYPGGGTTTDIGLNIMADLAGQDGSHGGVGQFRQSNDLPSNDYIGAPSGGFLESGGYADAFLISLDYLTEVPSGAVLKTSPKIYHASYGTYLPLETPTYLGVQFPTSGVPGIPDGTHYGWIGVEMFVDGTGAYCLDTFAWGYETTPDTPIAAGVPEPGTLALLAFGVCAAIRRRR